MPARIRKSKQTIDKDDKAHMSLTSKEQSNLQDSVRKAIKDDRMRVSDEPHRTYPQRYRLQTT